MSQVWVGAVRLGWRRRENGWKIFLYLSFILEALVRCPPVGSSLRFLFDCLFVRARYTTNT